MAPRGSGDSGQAFPVYVAVIAGLLFLGFAYFLVGQAALTRNSAQTAADAAALAAAEDAREQLRERWTEVILDPGQWDEFLQGEASTEFSACRRAAEFAVRNEAKLTGDGCMPLATGGHGFRVTVITTGRESHPATASAEAVLEPRCTFDPPEPPPDPPETTPPSPDEGGEDPDGGVPVVGLVCGGEPWVIDPDSPRLPDAVDLFRVRLSD
ncbi:pilus assembly protein TadG-related protein [Streptomyces sp. NPDC015661]|uniref:pilus assembly protein TadG-related protein n=1 Tax=Streptomyces sp. NPDC015661 TaxID=3364961 RepID=UPI003701CBC5